MIIEWCKVKEEINEWREIIGDDVADAIIYNLEEETIDE